VPGALYPEYPTRRQNEERFFTLLFFKKNNSMKKVIKQVLGIDVAQDELVVCFGRMYDDIRIELAAHKTFDNSKKGFASMVLWVEKLSTGDSRVRYVMEATGVYHELLAYYLVEQELEVSIVLPSKISNYMRTLSTKTVTDKTASEAIAQFGLERALDSWVIPAAVYRRMRQLTRERDQIIEERTMVKNQLHAEQAGAYSNKLSLSRIKKRIKLMDDQEKEIIAELQSHIKGDEKVSAGVALLCSIPGVGLLTAATVLGETNGFDLIRNKRQIVSYAGLDVREKQSGTSVKGKPKISKKGNRYLRKALHFPALTAIRHSDTMKATFARLVTRHGIKMKAAVAVQRKMLELMYTLHKTNTPYDKDYVINNASKSQLPA
jgi:transposase